LLARQGRQTQQEYREKPARHTSSLAASFSLPAAGPYPDPFPGTTAKPR
jgi:hypothetical protein